MSTQVMATQAPPSQVPEDSAPPALSKALEQVMQGLGKTIMELHKLDPESPLTDAAVSLQKATAEIARNVGMPSDPAAGGELPPGMESPDELAMEPPGDPAGAPEPPGSMEGPLPPGSTIEDAAGATHQMMQDAAKRRREGGGN